MAANTIYELRLLNLYCYRQDEADGDEVYLQYNENKIFPLDSKYIKMKEGEIKVGERINDIEKGTHINIELWDYDFLSPNDKLGEFLMLVNERGGPFKTDLKSVESEDAKYSLEWEVV